jgi:hypothetical protein
MSQYSLPCSGSDLGRLTSNRSSASHQRIVGAVLVFFSGLASALAADCAGTIVLGLGGVSKAWVLSDGGIAAFSKLNINIDGYGKAYHTRNAEAGALIHLCNAGQVFLPDGSSYEGSESNATCTGRFMQDVGRIGAAGWKDGTVGAVNWYGILGEGSVTIRGKVVRSVVPVLQKDGSGFYVSPTSLADRAIADQTDQSRYVNPLRIAAAVVPRSLIERGVAIGSFGVAFNVNKRIAVPFVVGDGGPRIGEGSVALARLASGMPLKDEITRGERFVGQVDARDVLWVFFKGTPDRFDSKNEGETTTKAKASYQSWGGDVRLAKCVEKVPRN